MKRITTALVFLTALLLLLAGCGAGTETPTASPSTSPSAAPSAAPTPSPTPTPEPEPTPEPGPEFVNPLTGLEIDEAHANTRPVAIMLNNIRQAMPMQGQSEADILYEMPVEGGITRMLGLYQNPESVPMIGSIRSARTCYLEIALGHDAVFIHAGGSPDAYDKIKKWSVTALDGVGAYGNTLTWRDDWRRKNLGLVHSVVTTGETIAERFPKYKFRKELNEGWEYAVTFAKAGSAAGGEAARSVTVTFPGGKTTGFALDETTGTYLVSQYGEPFKDMNNDAQVAVTNVLVVRTSCTAIKGDDSGRLDIDLSSGGEGLYACGGTYVPVRWEKEYPDGQLRFYTEGGEPVVLQPGKSFICVTTPKAKVIFS